ncbi:unnamed protein product [Anisakis simplex]|uniref:Cell division cycle associated 7 n=1 Tax=Anisakis simplex TaxID=6269 RepID=A0A0M3J8T3_ANISI|nr:unnamed protein product [Anisakis simplex]
MIFEESEPFDDDVEEEDGRKQPNPASEQSSQHGASEEIWMSKNFAMISSRPRKELPRKAANVIRMQPRPTRISDTHSQDLKSFLS